MTIGAIAAFLIVVFAALNRAPLVPMGDPYIQESLHHH